MRQIKSGSFTMSFSIDGTVYMLKMLKEDYIREQEPFVVSSDKGAPKERSEQSSGSSKKEFEKFVVELHAANKVVCLSKTLEDGKDPEYKMEGPGMNDEEMKQFVRNWKAIVAQEAVGFFENDDSLKSTVESFLRLFDHYFGNRIREMITEEQPEAQDSVFASVSNNHPRQVGSDQTQKRNSEPDTKSPEKKRREDE